MGSATAVIGMFAFILTGVAFLVVLLWKVCLHKRPAPKQIDTKNT